MAWIIIVFVAAVAIIVARVYFNMRRLRKENPRDSWDAKMIERLRSQGYAPFNDYPIDFFLALPDEAACEAVRARLEPQGYSVDVKPLQNDPELHFSLHATRKMRLIVPAMQEVGKELTALAEEHKGRYDGWAA